MSKILDFVKPGVVNSSDMHKIFNFAKKNNFAIPAINCINTDSINAVLEASSKTKSPVIIQLSYGGSSFFSGNLLFQYNKNTSAIIGAISAAYYVQQISKNYNIPIILHTDHCTKNNLEWLDGLIKENKKFFLKYKRPLFSSHMIDLSQESLKENIKTSLYYFKKLYKMDINLEIELGCTGGEEDGISNIKNNKLYTCPEDVCFAYEKLNLISKNFTIAASFGNVHGVYNPGYVKLKTKILLESQNYVSNKFNLPNNFLNLVFHGGSGSNLQDIKKSIKYGIVKINIDTDIQWASWLGILKYYKKNSDFLQNQLGNPLGKDQTNKKYYDPRIWLRESQKSIIKKLKIIFKNFNSLNKI